MKAIYCILNLALNNQLRSETEYKKKEASDRVEASVYIDIEEGNVDIKWIGQIGRSLRGLDLVNNYIQDSEGKDTYHLSDYGIELIDKIIENWENQYPELFGDFLNYERAVEHGRVKFITFHQSYSYEEFIEGIRPLVDSDELTYSLVKGVFKEISDNAKNHPNHNYVIIIDEINRGNISKIFGELITLIEPSKRLMSEDSNEYPKEVILPYSKKSFGVPKNLYILGTMNTADKSIALLDSALRRRFSFTEMLPKSSVIKDKISITGIEVANLFETINSRIEFLIDKDHTIGHSYFLKIKDNQTIEALALIFKNEIIPLLNEYFYGDFEKIQLVLGDNRKSKNDIHKFIKIKESKQKELFGRDDAVEGYDEKKIYELNEDLFGLEKDGSIKGSTEDLVKLFQSVYTLKSN
jgi:5-methylcytosine-specific restriction protein B